MAECQRFVIRTGKDDNRDPSVHRADLLKGFEFNCVRRCRSPDCVKLDLSEQVQRIGKSGGMFDLGNFRVRFQQRDTNIASMSLSSISSSRIGLGSAIGLTGKGNANTVSSFGPGTLVND